MGVVVAPPSPQDCDLLEVDEGISSSRGRRLGQIEAETAPADPPPTTTGANGRFIIDPENRWYRFWRQIIVLWAVYSSFFTPMEFGFFRGLPKSHQLFDICSQIVFLIDIVVNFNLSYRDPQTYRIVNSPSRIALRYLKGNFVIDLLSCMPWDVIYKASGRKEAIRYLLWIRLYRAKRVEGFFQRMEKNTRINYLFTRIVKLIVVELYCTHTAACIFYYLATTISPSKEGYTWIGSLKLGDYSYQNFRDLDLWKRYLTSMYFAIITMSTVGYGDIHAVNGREMVFIMIYVSFDMILGAYLIGNMTALIVKGSNTEKFRDKMTDLIKFMNRNRLEKDIRRQIKGHVRLQFESSYTDFSILEDMPVAIRDKISNTMYRSYVERVPLFKGCSEELIHQIVIKLQEEFYLPGEVIMEQGNAVDQLYIVCHGTLEGIGITIDESDENILKLESGSSFGDMAIICNIPQPYKVRVSRLCRLLRIERESFTDILQTHSSDWKIILENLLAKNESFGLKDLELDIMFHIQKQEADMTLKVNSAAYRGDLHRLKSLIQRGADPGGTDYNGRSALHLAASKGLEDIVLYLVHKGVDINKPDKFGKTPLLEALMNGHEHIASFLMKEGASIHIENAGCQLCMAVSRGDAEYVRRVLSYGIKPDVRDYDQRTPLHVAASEGLYMLAKILLESGANILSKDRWGHTPLDEARSSRNEPLIKLLESATPLELPGPHKVKDNFGRRKCTVFAFHPWDSPDKRSDGIVMWVPSTMEELIRFAEQHLECSASRVLSEDGGRLLDIDMISDGQKLYLASSTGGGHK